MRSNATNILSLPSLMLCFVFISIIFSGLPLLQRLSIFIFIHQVLSLFNSIGERLPIRTLMGTLFTLQLLIGPVVAYNGGDEYMIQAYKMRVDSETYFSYVVPATLLFLLGLNIKSRNRGEILNLEQLKLVNYRTQNITKYLILVGFIGDLLESVAPAEFKFVFYLISLVRFVAVFVSILTSERIVYWPIVVVYGHLVLESLRVGMFHDLITWSMFLGTVLMIRLKIKPVRKAILFLGFFVLVVFIQFIKMDFRESLSLGASADLETVSEVYNTTTIEKGGMFSQHNLYANSVRINQGFIVSNVMYNVPQNEPYSNGETLKQIFLSALFPRFLYPDKLNAGDQEIFTKYTGLQISRNTSMALSSVGDAYANFGKLGGWFFMFLYGGLFNLSLIFFQKRASKYPILILFLPIIFVYPIRPDCELQTILGHFIKGSFIVLLMLNWASGKLKVYANSHPVI